LINIVFLSITSILSYHLAVGQGFPWYGGDRNPYQVPELYLGAEIGFNTYWTNDAYSLSVDRFVVDSNHILSRSGFKMMFLNEYWLKSDLALSLRAGFSFNSEHTEREFSELVSPVGQKEWKQRNTIERNFLSIGLGIGAKQRIINYLSITAGFDLEIIADEQLIHTLTSLDSDLLYNESDVSIIIPDTDLNNDYSFGTRLRAGVAYDIPLITGLYLSPGVSGSLLYTFGQSSPLFYGFNFDLGVNYGFF